MSRELVALREARASVVFQLEHVRTYYSHTERARRAAPLERLLKEIDQLLEYGADPAPFEGSVYG